MGGRNTKMISAIYKDIRTILHKTSPAKYKEMVHEKTISTTRQAKYTEMKKLQLENKDDDDLYAPMKKSIKDYYNLQNEFEKQVIIFECFEYIFLTVC